MEPARTIAAFLDGYEGGAEQRPLTQDERHLLDEALTDFVVHEQWIAPDQACAELVAELQRLAAHPLLRRLPGAGATLIAAAGAITDHAARLRRREQANTIMRDALAILSDRRRGCRPADAPACSPPDHLSSSP